jgi:hypothetical protein
MKYNNMDFKHITLGKGALAEPSLTFSSGKNSKSSIHSQQMSLVNSGESLVSFSRKRLPCWGSQSRLKSEREQKGTPLVLNL